MKKIKRVKKHLIFILAIVLFVFLVLLLYPLIIGNNLKECSSDSECVPSACCHPASCAPISEKPNCDGIFCTQECAEGTLDCQQGSCACISGKCSVEWAGK